MHIVVEEARIEALWLALTKPDMGSNPRQASEISRAMLVRGYIDPLELEALLVAVEPRLYEVGFDTLLNIFGIQETWVYPRPKGTERLTFGIKSIVATDAVHLLILLERLGFGVDPAPLCEAMRPALQVRPYLTAAELAVYWYARERHRCEPLVLMVSPDPPRRKRDVLLTSASGHRIALYCGEDGKPLRIEAIAPGRRLRRSLQPAAA